jgi:hypothetical protein
MPGLDGLSKKLVESRLAEVGPADSSASKTSQLREKFAPDAVKIGDHYFKVVEQKGIAWTDAAKACQEAGGRLACLSDSDRKLVAAMKGKKSVWVGGFNTDQHTRKWITDELISDNQFTSSNSSQKRGKTEPNWGVSFSGGDLYIVRPANGFIAGADIPHVQGFICEWDE